VIITGKIFISHSKYDVEMIKTFNTAIQNLGHKAYIYDYEKHDDYLAPNEDIKLEIKKSNCLFIFLSENVINREHTKSWIISEAAIARDANIRVFLCKPNDLITEMVIPYISDYFIYNKNDPKDILTIQRIMKDNFNEQVGAKRTLVGGGLGGVLGIPFGPFGIIAGAIGGAILGKLTQPGNIYSLKIKCNKCNHSYIYYSTAINIFKCPICNNQIEVIKK